MAATHDEDRLDRAGLDRVADARRGLDDVIVERDLGTVTVLLNRVDEFVGDAHDNLARLCHRIAPVVGPDSPHAVARDGNDEATPTCSPVAERLTSLVASLARLNRDLVEIADRVEL